MKLINKEKAIDQYAQCCVDDMDIDTLMDIVKTNIEENLLEQTDEEVIEELSNGVYDIRLEIEK